LGLRRQADDQSSLWTLFISPVNRHESPNFLSYARPTAKQRGLRWLCALCGLVLCAVAGAVFWFSWTLATLELPVPSPGPIPPFQPSYGIVVLAGLYFVPLGSVGLYLLLRAFRRRLVTAEAAD